MRTGYGCIRYGIFIEYDHRSERSDERNELVYNVELYAELSLLFIEFFHHMHMLVIFD